MKLEIVRYSKKTIARFRDWNDQFVRDLEVLNVKGPEGRHAVGLNELGELDTREIEGFILCKFADLDYFEGVQLAASLTNSPAAEREQRARLYVENAAQQWSRLEVEASKQPDDEPLVESINPLDFGLDVAWLGVWREPMMGVMDNPWTSPLQLVEYENHGCFGPIAYPLKTESLRQFDWATGKEFYSVLHDFVIG